MKLRKLLQVLLLTGSLWVLVTNPARGDADSALSTQKAPLDTKVGQVKPITEIKRLSQIEHPSQSAQTLLVQSPTPQATPSVEVVQVRGVKANLTNKGLDLILQTSKAQVLQPINRSADNSFIADIPNAQLRIPRGGCIYISLH